MNMEQNVDLTSSVTVAIENGLPNKMTKEQFYTAVEKTSNMNEIYNRALQTVLSQNPDLTLKDNHDQVISLTCDEVENILMALDKENGDVEKE